MRQGETDMNGTSDQRELRRYLLGILEDEVSLSRIEMRLMTDDKFADEIGLAENSLIEDYLDDELDGQDRTHFDRHFLAAPERRHQLRLTKNLRKLSAADVKNTGPQLAKSGWFDAVLSSRWLRLTAATVVLLAAGLGVWRFFIFTSDTDRGLAQLQAAYRGQRPTESRSSAGFGYAPLIEVRGTVSPAADENARARAERYLLDATANSDDARAHHALGLYHLAAGSFDKALAELSFAVKSAPGNAAIHSDIGATYFEKAKRADFEKNPGESMQNLVLALESTDRALEIDPAFLPALFDRGLILQKMPLPEQAREAWEKYLQVDANSPWADEARRNLESQKNPSAGSIDKSAILKDFLGAYEARDDELAWKIASQTKELVTGVMLSMQLAREISEGGETKAAKTAHALAAFLYLGELEKQRSGDPYFAELARFYADTDAPRRIHLFDAHEKLREANELVVKSDFTSALAAAEQAAEMFSAADSPWEAGIANHRAAYCLTQLNKHAESNERLKSLAENCRSREYRWLEGFTEVWIGNNFSLLGEHSRALAHTQKSLEIAKEIGDTYNLLRAYNQLTIESFLIGDAPGALAAVRSSLSHPDLYFLSPRQKARNLLGGTETTFRLGHNAAAAAFSREAIYVASVEVKDKWLSHTVHTQLAAIHGASGRYTQAFEAIEKSLVMADSFDDAVMRQRLQTRSRLSSASLQRRSGDCRTATQNYDRVIDEYKEANFSLNKYEAHKGRLLCLIEQKENDLVDREIPELLKVFDENRQSISAEAERNTFFDNAQDVYDIATLYAYSHLRQPDIAFEYAENSRARSLLSSLKEKPGRTSKPLVLAEVRDRMPDDVQMLYFAVLEDRILAWKISNTKVFAAEQPIRVKDLDEKVRRYLELLTARGDLKPLAEDLYKLLIQPLAREIDSGKSICIVADKSLLRLPFASLISAESGKYLIEDNALLYAPSASVFIAGTENARGKGKTNETVVSIGNPTFSREEYPNLADLPAAAREAREITTLYTAAKLLTGGDAAKEPIIDHLPSASVVHFAGHYVPNTKFPGRSKFLLPPADLMLDEIPPAAVGDVRLVVLSACETGIERFYKGEGMIGAARAFLTMGVPLVVASQWSVDSDATAALMVDFHRKRKRESLATPTALQRSQIAMLRSEDPRFRAPFYWASFMPIGGYTNY